MTVGDLALIISILLFTLITYGHHKRYYRLFYDEKIVGVTLSIIFVITAIITCIQLGILLISNWNNQLII